MSNEILLFSARKEHLGTLYVANNTYNLEVKNINPNNKISEIRAVISKLTTEQIYKVNRKKDGELYVTERIEITNPRKKLIAVAESISKHIYTFGTIIAILKK